MLQIRTAQEHAHMKENTPYIKQKKPKNFWSTQTHCPLEHSPTFSLLKHSFASTEKYILTFLLVLSKACS